MASPGINSTGNFVLIIKREVYENKKQYQSKEDLKEAIKTTGSNVKLKEQKIYQNLIFPGVPTT